MLRYLSGVSLCVVLIVFFAFGSVHCAPRANVDNIIFDAGGIPQGKEISHEFTIENTGDETLTITVKPC